MTALFTSASIFLTPTNLASSLVLRCLPINRPYWTLIKKILQGTQLPKGNSWIQFSSNFYSRTDGLRKMHVHYRHLKAKIYWSNSSSFFLAQPSTSASLLHLFLVLAETRTQLMEKVTLCIVKTLAVDIW